MQKWLTKGNVNFAISALALIVAYCSYQISSDALEYEKQREIAGKSPAIILTLESNKIRFTLDKENARLQTVIFKFPDSLQLEPLITQGNNQTIAINEIERIVSDLFSGRVLRNDFRKELKIPVVIDYEAVVDRKSTLYREDHFLVFNICSTEDNSSPQLIYDHNRFNIGLVCPQGYDDKERLKLKHYLDDRFLQSMEYYKSIGLIQ